MAFAILRIKKLKTFSNIIGSQKHTDREVETPNADRRIQNLELIPNLEKKDFQTLVKDKIGEIKTRKDAVLCTELLLTASPDFFRPLAPEQAGYYEQERLQAWVDANLTWLQRRYGKNLVKATLHLDESTPHIAAYVVPMYEKAGEHRLSHRELFGGSLKDAKLSRLQDDYAQAMLSLELERGIRGSKAKHQRVSHHYGLVNQSEELERQALPVPLPEESAQDYHQRIKQPVEKIVNQAVIAEQRRQAVKASRASQRSLSRRMSDLEKLKPAAQAFHLLQQYAPENLKQAVRVVQAARGKALNR